MCVCVWGGGGRLSANNCPRGSAPRPLKQVLWLCGKWGKACTMKAPFSPWKLVWTESQSPERTCPIKISWGYKGNECGKFDFDSVPQWAVFLMGPNTESEGSHSPAAKKASSSTLWSATDRGAAAARRRRRRPGWRGAWPSLLAHAWAWMVVRVGRERRWCGSTSALPDPLGARLRDTIQPGPPEPPAGRPAQPHSCSRTTGSPFLCPPSGSCKKKQNREAFTD